MATLQGAAGAPTLGQQLSGMFAVSDAARAQNAARDKAAADTASPLGASDTEDRFLKLLVAQMRNQDPLNPLDNAQVTTQLAQISTVRGIEKLNQSMERMAVGSGMSSPIQAIGMIGRDLLVEGQRMTLAGAAQQPLRAGFELPAGAESVQVQVLDSAGQVVFDKSFGASAPGLQIFEWGGAGTRAGTYQLQVKALARGQPVPATPLVTARVLGVSGGADGVRIELSGRPAVAAEDIKAIL